jgi:outer membrane lipoprotein-sorting protein
LNPRTPEPWRWPRAVLRTQVGAVALLLAAATLAAPGECNSTATCLQLIQEHNADTRTLVARFTQRKRLALLDEPLVSTGRFAFRAPDRMLWEIETPRHARIVLDARGMHVPGLSEQERRGLAAAPLPMMKRMGAVFSGDLKVLQESFDITARPQATGIDVELEPREPALQRRIRHMSIHFEGADLLVSTIRIRNPLDDVLEIELHDVRRNEDIPASAFATNDGAT